MKKQKIALLSMIIVLAVFSLTAIFGTQQLFNKSKDKSNGADQAMKTVSATPALVAETTEEPVIHSFSYDVDISTNADQSTTKANTPGEVTTTPGTEVTPTPEPEVTKVPEEKSKYANFGISTAKDYVNIRKNASTTSAIVGKLYKNSACEIKKKKGSWYYVESGTVKGYVKKDFIKTGIPDDKLIDKYGTVSISVECDGLNVRKSPDTDAKKVDVVYKNEIYPVIKQNGKWIKVKITDDHVSGYVKKEYTDLIVNFKEAISKEEEEKTKQLKAEAKAKENAKREQQETKKKTRIRKTSSVSYNYSELTLLTCLIHSEAGHQSYETKLAVANVVLNRMKSSRYPNSMKSVIYQPSQFTVAASGSLQKQLNSYKYFSNSAQLLSKKAAKDALAGSNNIGSRMHFNSYATAVRNGKDHNPNAIKLGGLLFW